MKVEFSKEHKEIITLSQDAFELAAKLDIGESLDLIFASRHTFLNLPKNKENLNFILKTLFEESAFVKVSLDKEDFSEFELGTITRILEYFMRCRSMQFKIAVEQVFPSQYWDLSWQQLEYLENCLKGCFEPHLLPNQYYGLNSEEMGEDASLAYEIYCTIRQFLSLKESDGWFENGTGFYAPLKLTKIDLPKIEGHAELQYKLYEIVPSLRALIKVFAEMKMYEQLWNTVHANIRLPSCSKSEIVFDEEKNPTFVKCTECRK